MARRDTVYKKKQNSIGKDLRCSWLAKAEAAKPKLFRTPKKAQAVVRVEQDAKAFQGWKVVATDKPESLCNRPFLPGDSFILDFGEHLTGYLVISLQRLDIPVDAPVRLLFVFGEMPAEVVEPFDPYTGDLSRSWLQDELVNFDEVPQIATLPRRYAFRYVKVTVVSCSRHGRFCFGDIYAESVTSADESRLLPFAAQTPEEAALDRVSVRTLRDCMQTVFEDGPKRDRRLWLGDLRLQALANYATYRQFDLVKRSLYLLAGTATDQGLVGTCAFERPEAMRGGDSILDVIALFAPTVLEYLEASGDRETAEDLWPLVVKQLDFTLESVNPEGLFVSRNNWWLFVDWHPTLEKQASLHAIILFGLRATLLLAGRLGKTAEVGLVARMIPRLETAARRHFWDESLGLFVSGPERQISWASQVWMILAGVPTLPEARRAMSVVIEYPGAEKPVTPYLHYYAVEAMYAAGLAGEARQHMLSYWGDMVRKGADTFWEVYVPGEDFSSPYRSHLMNSYCHAWSCTPSCLLRREKSPVVSQGGSGSDGLSDKKLKSPSPRSKK